MISNLENKIIEFNGDFWHMNPDMYDSDYCSSLYKSFCRRKMGI